MTAGEPNESGIRWKSRDLQIEFRGVHTEVLAGLADVGQMAKCSLSLEERLRESD